MTFTDWFTKNKVLIIGLASAIALPVYELISKGDTSSKIIITAVAVALTSYLARNLRGQWQTIASIVGTVLATYIVQDQTGNVSVAQLIMQFIILFLGASSAPAKSIGYEHTPVIMEAKKEGESIVPTPAPPPAEPSIKYTPLK